MKQVRVLWAVSVWLLTMSAGTAQTSLSDNIMPHTLSVQGKVRVFATADRATVTFEIKGVGKTLAAAFDQARLRVDSLATRLYALGLSDDALATSLFSSQENYGDKAWLSSKRDYRATMTATVTTDSLELLESVVIALSESEIESINSIVFELINYEQVRKDALVKAVKKAREKAELICVELNTPITGVLQVEEVQREPKERQEFPRYLRQSPFNAPLMMLSGVDAFGGEEIAAIFAQEIQFDAEVRVVFALGESR